MHSRCSCSTRLVPLFTVLIGVSSWGVGDENPNLVSTEKLLHQQEITRFLIAEQENSSSLFDRLSFVAEVRTTTFFQELNESIPIYSRYILIKRSSTYLLTWECMTTLNTQNTGINGQASPVFVSKSPLVRRILRTPEYVATWTDVSKPTATIAFSEDWKNNVREYFRKSDGLYSPIEISRICFGVVTPLSELVPRSSESTVWSVAKASEHPFEQIILERTLQLDNGHTNVDLVLKLWLAGGLLAEGTFQPVKSSTVQKVAIEYQEDALGLTLPHVYSSTIEGGKLHGTGVIMRFLDYADETSMPDFEFEDLALPRGSTVLRIWPDGKVAPITDGEIRNRIGRKER